MVYTNNCARTVLRKISQSGCDEKLLEKYNSLKRLVQKNNAQKMRCLRILFDCISKNSTRKIGQFDLYNMATYLNDYFRMTNDISFVLNG